MMSEKPNILLITTDQQRFDTIAALGNNAIYTPHLDWLVEGGLTFTRAYSDCPICMPARATIMTGKHSYTLGITGNGTHYPLNDHRTLPQILTEAGYQTRAQGKMHFLPMRCNYGFEHMELTTDYYRECQEKGVGKLPRQHGVGENETVPVISTVEEQNSLTHWTVKRSVDFLETRDETRPFFMWTSFAKPHPPFDPCLNYWNLYANQEISSPVYGDWSQDLQAMPQGFLASTYTLNSTHRMSNDQLKNMKRAYYACITQIDYQLGLLFSRMREMGILEKTWIIFTSDHGEMLGDHRMGAKSVFLEGSTHIPLIVRPPLTDIDGVYKLEASQFRGRRISHLAQLTDIMPTILAAARVEIPEDIDGLDLMTFTTEQGANERIFIGECGDYQFAVMDKQFKYTVTAFGKEELLFDLVKDPMEQNNLAGKQEFCEIQQNLKTVLLTHLEKHNSRMFENGELKNKGTINSAADVARWPGLHSLHDESDLLH
jgi:arylsulfatase A-like enzyme